MSFIQLCSSRNLICRFGNECHTATIILAIFDGRSRVLCISSMCSGFCDYFKGALGFAATSASSFRTSVDVVALLSPSTSFIVFILMKFSASRWAHFLSMSLSFFLSWADAATNVTLDDTDSAITYSQTSYGTWCDPNCSYCSAKPNPVLCYGGTW